MDYFAGLDVSVKETSVCIVDDAGIYSLRLLQVRHKQTEASTIRLSPIN